METEIRRILVKHSDNKRANDEIEKEINLLIQKERRDTAKIYLHFVISEFENKRDLFNLSVNRYDEVSTVNDCIKIVEKIISQI